MTKSESNSAEKKETERTPSMLTSLLVFGVMIGLIFLSVALFGDEVAAGPQQVSITLVSLFALGVAYFYGYHRAILSAICRRWSLSCLLSLT